GARAKLGANLAIIEFSDFQCPFCGRYARETFPLLKREFIDTGEVNYVFMHFPLEALHPDALKAAEAAACAGRQDKFWGMHDRLFANQAALLLPSIMNYARELRLDEPNFEKCLVSIGSAVQDDMEEGRRVGV